MVNGSPVTDDFVSSSIGRADGTGTLDSPLRTLKAAIARSRVIGEPFVACAEHFAESLEILAGVSMIGNFDCTPPSGGGGKGRVTAGTAPPLTRGIARQGTRTSWAIPCAEAGTVLGLPSASGFDSSGTPSPPRPALLVVLVIVGAAAVNARP